MAPEILPCIENIVDLSSLSFNLNNLEFCEYIRVCDEGNCSKSCYKANCNKCHYYQNFRRGIWH